LLLNPLSYSPKARKNRTRTCNTQCVICCVCLYL
jgi:hypothetical protein